jgi:hypothetical protein
MMGVGLFWSGTRVEEYEKSWKFIGVVKHGEDLRSSFACSQKKQLFRKKANLPLGSGLGLGPGFGFGFGIGILIMPDTTSSASCVDVICCHLLTPQMDGRMGVFIPVVSSALDPRLSSLDIIIFV